MRFTCTLTASLSCLSSRSSAFPVAVWRVQTGHYAAGPRVWVCVLYFLQLRPWLHILAAAPQRGVVPAQPASAVMCCVLSLSAGASAPREPASSALRTAGPGTWQVLRE